MSTTAYAPLTEAESIFKSLVWDPLIRAGESWLFIEAPILAAPILREIDSALISVLSDVVFEKLRLFIDVTAIRFVKEEHQKAYTDASLKLKIIALEKGIDSAEFKKANEDEKAAFLAFVHIGP